MGAESIRPSAPRPVRVADGGDQRGAVTTATGRRVGAGISDVHGWDQYVRDDLAKIDSPKSLPHLRNTAYLDFISDLLARVNSDHSVATTNDKVDRAADVMEKKFGNDPGMKALIKSYPNLINDAVADAKATIEISSKGRSSVVLHLSSGPDAPSLKASENRWDDKVTYIPWLHSEIGISLNNIPRLP